MMGSGIAASVMRAGHPLCFLKRETTAATGALIDAGAVPLATIAEVAQGAEHLILCVTGAPEVEAVMAEAMPHIRAGMTVIDCSTSLPETSRALASQLAEQGGAFLDAPMTRTPKEAAEGRLGLIVGGAPETFEATLPLLQTFGESITHVGGVGAGHAAKLAHNYVSLGFAAVMAETLACAEKSGIEMGPFLEVLAAGGGNSVILDRMRPYMESDDDSSFRFALRNARKDFGYYTGMAQGAGARHEIADAVKALYGEASTARPEGVIPELFDHLKGA
jgi:3-hydroxyisobutyrate dehydrogenase